MKRVVVVVWAVILGIIAGFIGAKLDQSDFNLKMSLITFFIFGLLLNFIPEITRNSNPEDKKES